LILVSERSVRQTVKLSLLDLVQNLQKKSYFHKLSNNQIVDPIFFTKVFTLIIYAFHVLI